jgi:hypothetical protein
VLVKRVKQVQRNGPEKVEEPPTRSGWRLAQGESVSTDLP